MWEMTYNFEMGEVCEKRLKYVCNAVDIWEMAKICVKWLKYLTNGYFMW